MLLLYPSIFGVIPQCLRVSINGDTPKSHIFIGISPYKPSSYGGTPMTWETSNISWSPLIFGRLYQLYHYSLQLGWWGWRLSDKVRLSGWRLDFCCSKRSLKCWICHSLRIRWYQILILPVAHVNSKEIRVMQTRRHTGGFRGLGEGYIPRVNSKHLQHFTLTAHTFELDFQDLSGRNNMNYFGFRLPPVAQASSNDSNPVFRGTDWPRKDMQWELWMIVTSLLIHIVIHIISDSSW